jgi:hypothetical protein
MIPTEPGVHVDAQVSARWGGFDHGMWQAERVRIVSLPGPSVSQERVCQGGSGKV